MNLQKHFESKIFRRPWRLTGGVLLLISVSMLGLWPFLNRSLSTTNEKLAMLLAIGQFFSGLLLIPVAIFGFEFARREFEEGQAKPDLDLAICDPLDSCLKREATLEATTYANLMSFVVNIHIKNSGNAIADLYMIELTGLRQLNLAGARRISELNEHTPSPPSGWKDETEDKDKLTFICRNTHPVFPQQDSPLCELKVNIEAASYRAPFLIGYKIYVGSETPVEAGLKINLKAPTPVGSARHLTVGKG